MNRLLSFGLIAIFAAFVGSQITEGCLLLPYWKTLPAADFYGYYAVFGPGIGKFYTILTILAALIPLFIGTYCFIKKSPAFKYALLSVVFTIAFVAFFYIYFKGANEQFLQGTLAGPELKSELKVWGNWHWVRVGIEVLATIFLALSLNVLTRQKAV